MKMRMRTGSYSPTCVAIPSGSQLKPDHRKPLKTLARTSVPCDSVSFSTPLAFPIAHPVRHDGRLSPPSPERPRLTEMVRLQSLYDNWVKDADASEMVSETDPGAVSKSRLDVTPICTASST